MAEPKLSDLMSEPTAAERTAALMRDEIAGLSNHIRASYENLLRTIWQNPYGLSPQDVFDVLGNRGAAFVRARGLFEQLLTEAFPANPPSDPKPKYAVLQVNEDGTVAVK